MRFYQIRITDPRTGNVLVPASSLGTNTVRKGFVPVKNDGLTWTYSSLNAGASVYQRGGSNPAALRVELDVPVTAFHVPGSNASIVVHGVSLAEIGSATDLTNMNIALYGGMAKGLPLANPAQARLLASGLILQAVGNWLGTDQSIRLYISAGGDNPSSSQVTAIPITDSTVPSPATNSTPANIILSWPKGGRMIDAITQTLSNAFPQYSIVGAISPNLVNVGEPITGSYAKVQQFAGDVYRKSISIINGYAPPVPNPYPGAQISLFHNTFTVTDGTIQTAPKVINITDVIGQPSWNGPYSCQVTLVMRGDIQMGDWVTLPAEPTLTIAQFANPSATIKNSLVFSGTFQVLGIRHVGDSRGADAAAWVTVVDLQLPFNRPQTSSTSSTSSRLYQTTPVFPTLYTRSGYKFYLPN